MPSTSTHMTKHPLHLRAITLNLHGYHPMGEAPRAWLHPDGRVEPTTDHLFHFSAQEIYRGNRRRLNRLAHDLCDLAPDFVLLQEVAAGGPDTKKNPAVFDRTEPADGDETNTAQRLRWRMPGYACVTACRGNTGWITGANHFATASMGAITPDGPQVIFPVGTCPYPNGLIVEGFAILFNAAWTCQHNETWTVPYNPQGEITTVQAARFTRDDHSLLIINLHAGHKLAHFEQAVALRRRISEELAKCPAGTELLVGGDFNSVLYRPGGTKPLSAGFKGTSQAVEAYADQTTPGDIALVPWEVAQPGHFDFRISEPSWDQLVPSLTAYSADNHYKPWASVDGKEAKARIRTAVDAFAIWQHNATHGMCPLLEALETAPQPPDLNNVTGLHPATMLDHRIDFLFSTPGLQPTAATLLYANAWTESLTTVSDHPALLADYLIED